MTFSSRICSRSIALATVLVTATACGYSQSGKNTQSTYEQRPPLASHTSHGFHGMLNRAAEHLARSALQKRHKDKPVVVASFVSIDNLDQSSTLGRLAAKRVSGKLVRMGYKVRELNLRETLAVREGTGELMLSRDLEALSNQAEAQAFVTGTYAVGGESIAFHLNIVRASDGAVLAASDFVVRRNKDIEGYLRPRGLRSFEVDGEI